MAKAYQALKDEEILRVARMEVTESAAGTFTETEFDTQLSIERGIIWLIHQIEFYHELDRLTEAAASVVETNALQLTRESKAAEVDFNDADLIDKSRYALSRGGVIGTDAGPLYHHDNAPIVHTFKVPIPYASMAIYLGMKTSGAVVQQGFARVRYTIRSVSDKYFFRVAQALLG